MQNANDDSLPTPRSEPIALEHGMRISSEGDTWTIIVGGGNQPEWTATGDSLENCIADLVLKTSEDAIQDEAIEWDNHIKGSMV